MILPLLIPYGGSPMLKFLKAIFSEGGGNRRMESYEEEFLELRKEVEDEIRFLEEMFVTQRIDAETHAKMATAKARQYAATDPERALIYLRVAQFQRLSVKAIEEQRHHAVLADDRALTEEFRAMAGGVAKQLESGKLLTTAQMLLAKYGGKSLPESPEGKPEQSKPRFDSDYETPKPSKNGTA